MSQPSCTAGTQAQARPRAALRAVPRITERAGRCGGRVRRSGLRAGPRRGLAGGCLLLLLAGGCAQQQSPPPAPAGPANDRLIELLMPHRIRIVEAFTGFASFDDDQRPDGIEALLQPLDVFGDPVKMAGQLRFELFAFNPASGVRAGERLCNPWDIPLASEADQRRFWNEVTGMYEIKLEFPAGMQPAGRKYVLRATYLTPLDSYLADECVLTAPTGLALR